MSKKEEIAFMQGYVCAVAILVQQHDIGSMAEDALREVGRINWSHIDIIDREHLKNGNIKLKDFS